MKVVGPISRVVLALVVPVTGLAIACSSGTGAIEAPRPASTAVTPALLSPWERMVKAGQKEGIVTYYIEAGSETRTAVSQELYTKYGIQVEMVIGKGAELLAKINTERQAGVYWADLASIGETSTITLKGTGALLPLDRYLVSPEVKDAKAWPDGQLRFSDEKHSAVTLSYYYQPFILINTDMVRPNEIASHMDLLDPKWKGKITLFDPTTGAGLVWIGWLQRTIGEPAADKFFQQLARQDLVITRDSRLHAESVARGKYPIGIGYSMSATGNLLKIGAPIAPLSTAEGGLVGIGSGLVAMMDKGPNPDAAGVLLNWLLTREGQKIYAEAANYIPMRLDVAPTWVDPRLVPPRDARLLWPDEEFRNFLNQGALDVAKKNFGPLIK